MALLKHARALWFPDISYSFYPVYCGLYGIAHRQVPLAEDFSIRVEDYLPQPGQTAAERPGAIIFPNPNAPTGRLLALAEVERIVAGNPDAVVLVDEAYVDFGGDSAIALVDRHPNSARHPHLLQEPFARRPARGLRGRPCGADRGPGAGQEQLQLLSARPPGDRRRGGLGGGRGLLPGQLPQGDRDARKLVADMQALGFEVLPSAANFIFARHPSHDGAALTAELRQRAIIVRHFKAPRIDQFMRITIGTDAQCAALTVAALRELIAA